MQNIIILIIAIISAIVRGQSFLSAISVYPQLSNFSSFFQQNEGIASLLLFSSSKLPYTVLVPNNDAFANYQVEYGVPVTSLSPAEIETLIQYHILIGELTSANLTNPVGLTVPSLLEGQTYDNRSAGSALSSNFGDRNDTGGQVVFISTSLQTSKRSVSNRQVGLQDVQVHSGLSSSVNLQVIDGVWDGGWFQDVDRFLTLPGNCPETVRNAGLTSFDAAFNRTDLWNDLDTSSNYTCLSPNDAAFAAAGSPEIKLNESALSDSMEMHTIPQVLYTNFLQDGQNYLSDNNKTIRISIQGQDIYFNDAKLLQANIITVNGVLHVLDRVMSELKDVNSTSSSTNSVTASSTAPVPSATKTSSGSKERTWWPWKRSSLILYMILICRFVWV